MKYWLLLFLIFTSFSSPRTLYNSLDPRSLAEHLAFYELYSNTPEGEKALHDIKSILSTYENHSLSLDQLKKALKGVISLTNKNERDPLPLLEWDELTMIDEVAKRLPNRKLKGAHAVTEKEVQELENHEIDLARALFLSEMGEKEMQKIRSYEAYLDLMALQIQARLPEKASVQDKVSAINHFIFYEMGFRFPPHSLYAKDIDLYTFLPSVLDSRRGVCLGVSILYITLAQRLDLPLEMVTPPGHIYVRARDEDNIINIETTARGINVDSKCYLGVDTRSLDVRQVKEVVGMAHFNQASLYFQNGEPEKAIAAYTKALPYMPKDKLLIELLGYNYLLAGDSERGKYYLEKVRGHLHEWAVSKNSIPEDFLNGKVDVEGLKVVFQHVDEKRSSVIKKKEEIEALLKRCPEFRGGWFYLGVTYLQLHRLKEGLKALEKFHELDREDATTEYYLSALYTERMNYKKAWEHLKQAEKLTQARNHSPQALEELRRELMIIYPYQEEDL